MKELSNLDIAHEGDVLGDAYEYLIGQFASTSGKKAGEFYTPQPVSELMTRIVIKGREDKKGFTAYDASMGSGSLLLNIRNYSNESGTISYYGQELNTSTYNLARMNMILHEVSVENHHLHNSDTLDQDWPTEEPTNFDAVLMNPPYSAKWSADKGFLDDPRFSPYGVLAPKSRADFAFLLHGYYHLKDTGKMAIVLPHGVLFRGHAEEKIRKILLDNGAIDTVIGLPANIFFNTSIPTTIVVLKKNRSNKDVLFIDASKEFEKGRNQNLLKPEHIDKIVDTFVKRENVEKFAHVASFDEIKENDYNLNIPRYVDTFEEEEPIDIAALGKELVNLNDEIKQAEQELLNMLDDLEVTEESRDIIEAAREVFR
jgi:type I restriction enzyme M protein